MFNIFGKSKKPAALVIHDGRSWYVEVFLFSKKEAMSLGSETVQGANPLKLPEEIPAFALEHGAKRIKILVPADVHVIDMEISEDLELDEAQAATAFELMELTDLEAHEIRPACLRADLFGMGGLKTNLLASPFENRIIEIFEESCSSAGAWFEGLCSLELGILIQHANYFPDDRCLIIRPRNSSLYITPAREAQPFSVQTLPVTFTPEDKQDHPERYERVARVLNLNQETALHIWSFNPLDTGARDFIRNETGYATELVFYTLDEHLESISAGAVNTPELDQIHNIAMFVGKNEELKDPYRAGTWMFLIFILVSALAMGANYYKLSSDLKHLRERQSAYNKLSSSKKSLESKLEGHKKRQTKSLQAQKVLTRVNGLPDGLLTLLDCLREQMPVYTKVNRIYEYAPPKDGPKTLVVEGSSFYQEGIDILSSRISEVLKPEELIVEPGGIQSDESTGELRFTFRIVPLKEARS